MSIFSKISAGALAAIVGISAFGSLASAQVAMTPPSIMPPFAAQFKQLSNGTVTSIDRADAPTDGSKMAMAYPMTLTVESTEQICPPAKPGMATCLAFGFKSYQVVVTSQTALLAKDRTPLKDTIEVGDHVNVYGTIDPNTDAITAQIVRDLDKPFSSRLMQLEGLRVTGVVQGKDGIQVTATQGSGPCWNYQGNARLAYPCPAGTQPADTVRTSEMPALAVTNVYSISVPRTARILDVNRRVIDPAKVQVGATINVYGTLIARGMMQAQILRVTSEVATVGKMKVGVLSGSAVVRTGKKLDIQMQVTGGNAPYSWSATGLPSGIQLQNETSVINCLVAPCPEPAMDNARASLRGSVNKAGVYNVVVTATDASGAGATLTFPITVTGTDVIPAVQVTVKTDRTSYRMDQKVGIDVTATNTTRQDQTIQFNSGCEADYDVLPGFSLRTLRLCTTMLGTLTLKAGDSKTYHFDHDLAAHPMPKLALPFDLTVVGRVTGVADEASTKITIKR